MNNFKAIFKLAAVYTGTVIGAGFASGQEIWRFFGRYGNIGAVGVIIAAVILSLAGAGILLKIYRLKLGSFDQYCHATFGKRSAGVISIICAAFMYAVFCVMLAASGALFYQELGMSNITGIIALATACSLVFVFDIRGLTFISSLLSPLMLIGIIILGAYACIFGDRGVINAFSELLAISDNWAMSAIIYASYNFLSVPAVMAPLRREITSKTVAILGGALGGIILGIGAICVLMVTLNYGISHQLPVLSAAGEIGINFKLYYGIVIYMAMLTSAIACGTGFLKYISNQSTMPKTLNIIILVISASLFALMGFSQLIGSFYTLFGYLGLLITLIILKDSIIELCYLKKIK